MMPMKPTEHDSGQQDPLLAGSQKQAQQRKWVKRYRTEVAASASSVLSTFAAVSLSSTSHMYLCPDTDMV
jgi:hypothetical protein